MCFPTVAAMSSWFRPVRLAIMHDHTMGSLFFSLVRALRSALHTHADLVVENLALRQQLANFQRTSWCPETDRWNSCTRSRRCAA